MWWKSWPEVIYDFTGFAVPQQGDQCKETADPANKTAGCGGGKGCPCWHWEAAGILHKDITTKELLELQQSAEVEAEEELFDMPETLSTLSIKQMEDFQELATNLCSGILESNPNAMRSSHIRSYITQNLQCYTEPLRDKTSHAKRTKVSDFFKPRSANTRPHLFSSLTTSEASFTFSEQWSEYIYL